MASSSSRCRVRSPLVTGPGATTASGPGSRSRPRSPSGGGCGTPIACTLAIARSPEGQGRASGSAWTQATSEVVMTSAPPHVDHRFDCEAEPPRRIDALNQYFEGNYLLATERGKDCSPNREDRGGSSKMFRRRVPV